MKKFLLESQTTCKSLWSVGGQRITVLGKNAWWVEDRGCTQEAKFQFSKGKVFFEQTVFSVQSLTTVSSVEEEKACAAFSQTFIGPQMKKLFFPLESNCLLLLYFSKLLFPPGETRRRIFIAPPQHQIGGKIFPHTHSRWCCNKIYSIISCWKWEKRKKSGLLFYIHSHGGNWEDSSWFWQPFLYF